jgi:hypothetical protein
MQFPDFARFAGPGFNRVTANRALCVLGRLLWGGFFTTA